MTCRVNREHEISPVSRYLNVTINPVLDSSSKERLIYGDYMVPGAEPTVYEEVPDLDKLTVRTCCDRGWIHGVSASFARKPHM